MKYEGFILIENLAVVTIIDIPHANRVLAYNAYTNVAK